MLPAARSFIALAICFAGCGGSGLLSEVDQPIEEGATPFLRWDPFPTKDYDPVRPLISDVSYELRVWKARYVRRNPRERGWVPDLLVYRRESLQANTHRLEDRLPTEADYVWSVRAHFKMSGQPRVSPWSARWDWDLSSRFPPPGYAHFRLPVGPTGG